MNVSDIIASALVLIGRKELVPFIEDPSNAMDDDAGEVIETLLYCYNAVEDELARKYIPLIAREQMHSENGKFRYFDLPLSPIKIRKVTVNGKSVKFDALTGYMTVNAKDIVVEYEYAPPRKGIDEFSDYDGEVGEYLLALGIAAEYALINGEGEMADRWEKKYRAELDRVQRTLPVCASIPPRRWI